MPELRIEITPCHEDWEKMNQVEKGRFCNACQKKVIDFTSSNSETILKTIRQTNGEFCGRFSTTNLVSGAVTSSSGSLVRYQLVKILILAIIMHFCLITAKAQTIQKDSLAGKPDQDEKKPLVRAGKDCVLEGTVKEDETSELIVGAFVSVLQNGKMVGQGITDSVGHFNIKLLKGTYYEGSFDLSTRYIGYERQLMKGIPTGKKEYILYIYLKPNREEFTVTVLGQGSVGKPYIMGISSMTTNLLMYDEQLIYQSGTETFITKTGVKRIPW